MPVPARIDLPLPDTVVSDVTALRQKCAQRGYAVNAADFGSCMDLLLTLAQYVMSHEGSLLGHRHLVPGVGMSDRAAV